MSRAHICPLHAPKSWGALAQGSCQHLPSSNWGKRSAKGTFAASSFPRCLGTAAFKHRQRLTRSPEPRQQSTTAGAR